MRIYKSYIINENTVKFFPFVAENGELYTFVVEKEKNIIISKSPCLLIEESKRFYFRRKLIARVEPHWKSYSMYNGKLIQANFRFTISE